ncbi:MAG: hypothetical protein AB7P31_08840 [Steroidobacteraceae bacterium]
MALYDALVGINVPSDKARAVVDAMERDMGTSLATKSDLQMLQQQLSARIDLLEQRLDSTRLSIEKDMELLRTSLTVRLGSMLMVAIGLLFAALKLT